MHGSSLPRLPPRSYVSSFHILLVPWPVAPTARLALLSVVVDTTGCFLPSLILIPLSLLSFPPFFVSNDVPTPWPPRGGRSLRRGQETGPKKRYESASGGAFSVFLEKVRSVKPCLSRQRPPCGDFFNPVFQLDFSAVLLFSSSRRAGKICAAEKRHSQEKDNTHADDRPG